MFVPFQIIAHKHTRSRKESQKNQRKNTVTNTDSMKIILNKRQQYLFKSITKWNDLNIENFAKRKQMKKKRREQKTTATTSIIIKEKWNGERTQNTCPFILKFSFNLIVVDVLSTIIWLLFNLDESKWPFPLVFQWLAMWKRKKNAIALGKWQCINDLEKKKKNPRIVSSTDQNNRVLAGQVALKISRRVNQKPARSGQISENAFSSAYSGIL